MPPDELVRIIRPVQDILRGTDNDPTPQNAKEARIRIVTGGVVGVWSTAITNLVNVIYETQVPVEGQSFDPVRVDGIGFHPYAKLAGGEPSSLGWDEDIRDVVEAAFDLTVVDDGPGIPIYATEFGLSV